jgi:hemerythrin
MSPHSKSEVMSPFEWRSELLLHVVEIDQQHRELLVRARFLRDSIDAVKPWRELQVMISALIDFTEMHFHAEEELMLAHGYEGFRAHQAAHAKLLDQAYLLRREFSTGAINPCHLLADFIQAWTEEHIVGPDKQFCAFLASERPSEGPHE